MRSSKELLEIMVLAKLKGKDAYLESVEGDFSVKMVNICTYAGKSECVVVEQFSIHAVDGFNFVPVEAINERFAITIK